MRLTRTADRDGSRLIAGDRHQDTKGRIVRVVRVFGPIAVVQTVARWVG